MYISQLLYIFKYFKRALFIIREAQHEAVKETGEWMKLHMEENNFYSSINDEIGVHVARMAEVRE